MKLSNLVCEHNSKWTENVSCALKILGREHVANMKLDLKKEISDVSIHLKIYKFYNQFRPFLVDVSFNFCNVLNKKNIAHFYINTILRVLSKYSNVIKCPLKVSLHFMLFFI